MGLTLHSYDLLMRHAKPGTMLELGNQTIYFGLEYGKPAKPMFNLMGFQHTSVDMNGQDGALAIDLSKINPCEIGENYDVVTDFGTSEHVKNYYNCWCNKYAACKTGGLVVSENPKTGNWPGHGLHYLTENFYKSLAEATQMDILELGESAAMGNVTDGWNIYAALRKTQKEFISEKEFNKLDFLPK